MNLFVTGLSFLSLIKTENWRRVPCPPQARARRAVRVRVSGAAVLPRPNTSCEADIQTLASFRYVCPAHKYSVGGLFWLDRYSATARQWRGQVFYSDAIPAWPTLPPDRHLILMKNVASSEFLSLESGLTCGHRAAPLR